MTREEFESILEEAYIDGYNSAIEDIQEDILNEEAYDLERDYEYYNESKNVRKRMDELDTDKCNSLTNDSGELYRNYKPRNPKRNWVKFSDKGYDSAGYYRGNSADSTYTVTNIDP